MEVNGTHSVVYAGQGGSATPVSVPQPSHAPEKENTTSDSAVSAAASQIAPQKVAESKQTSGSDKDHKDQRDQKEKQVSDDQIKQAVKEINKNANGTEAIFGIHDKTNRVTIKIVDKKTKEVVKEVPAEKTLDLIAKAWEMAGLLVDEKR